MITDERKGELMANLEYTVNKFLDKSDTVSDAIRSESENEEEKQFLYDCFSYFSVMLPEDK
ncbi:hypothetical protein [Pseudomonas phage vB_PsaM_M1]|nr:hypothetical protein [Pseudomonas phage vB_PsaM_M1]